MRPGVTAAIVVGLLIIAGGLAFVLTSGNSTPANKLKPVAEPIMGTFTIAEVSAHNTEQDCWSIIDGNVYNLTSYVPRHPGGDEILRACGTDGTMLFFTRTDENGEAIGSGEPHSDRAMSELGRLKIGELSKDVTP